MKSTKTIIETSWEYFSILTYDQKDQVSFYIVNILVLHIFKVLCDSRHNFSNTTYTASRNSSRFSTKIYIWTCWDVGVDIPSPFWPQQLPWQSSSNSYINKTLEGLVTKLHNREIIGCGVTLQLCDKGCSVVSLAMEAMKFSVLQLMYTVS